MKIKIPKFVQQLVKDSENKQELKLKPHVNTDIKKFITFYNKKDSYHSLPK